MSTSRARTTSLRSRRDPAGRQSTDVAALTLPDGETIAIVDGAAEIRDASGALLVSYRGGAATICAPSGDLTLAAPHGRVVIRSGADVEVDAARDLVQRAGRRAAVSAPLLDVEAGESRVTTGQASILAQRIVTTATAISQQTERFELAATRLFEKTRDTYREAADLYQTRAGRARTLVDDLYALYARRTAIASKEETSIDGSKVLLG